MPAELIEDALPAAGTQLCLPVGVLQQAVYGLHQGINAFGRHNNTRIAHYFGQGTAIGRDYRDTTGHGLARGQNAFS